MSLDFLYIVFLLGAVQGLILALYLFFSRGDRRQAKYFLGFLILVLSYDLFETALSAQRIRLFTTDLFAFSLFFTLGPSLYLTIKTSINPYRVSRRTILLCYLPALSDFVISSIIFALRFTQDLSIKTFVAINSTHLVSTRILMVIVFWIFFVFAFKDFQKFARNRWVTDWQASESEREIIERWLRSFLYACFFIAVVWTLTIFGVMFFDRERVLFYYYPLELLLAVLVYWIGFTGYHRIKVVYLNEQRNTRQYFNKLSRAEIDNAIAALSRAMTVDKIYLDPELTLMKLATRVGLPPKTISAILNQDLKVGFNEYVNGFRVEEVKKRLADPQNDSLTILAVALNSGFNFSPHFSESFQKPDRHYAEAIFGATQADHLKISQKKNSQIPI
jgi:AraC-like DNA-binding protein